jgi:hypothetical protein
MPWFLDSEHNVVSVEQEDDPFACLGTCTSSGSRATAVGKRRYERRGCRAKGVVGIVVVVVVVVVVGIIGIIGIIGICILRVGVGPRTP